jgi:hypothetical protein
MRDERVPRGAVVEWIVAEDGTATFHADLIRDQAYLGRPTNIYRVQRGFLPL